MKPEKKFVRELNDKVGLIEKTNTQVSPGTRSVNYQRITLQDEEGGKIKTTLYNDDIKAYEEIIQNHMEYDISNAKIKPMPEKYRTNASDHPFQLGIGATTIITSVEGSKPYLGPEYISIAAIPRTITADDRYDVLGIIIYVEPLRQVPRPGGQSLDIREIVLLDHSTEQPLIITATTEGNQIQEMANTFPVIGFTYLRPSYHKGFSVSTTSSTFVKFNPEGKKADMPRAWAEANKIAISANKHEQVLAARLPGTERITTTTKNLRNKKAAETLQDERHWLHISIPEFDRKDVRFYLGCDNFGTVSWRLCHLSVTK